MTQNHDFALTVESNIQATNIKAIKINVRVFEKERIIQVIQLDLKNGTLQHPPYAIKLMNFLKEQFERGELKHYKLHQEKFPLDFSKKSPVKLQFLPPRNKGETRVAFYFYRDENDNFTCEDVVAGDILPWEE